MVKHNGERRNHTIIFNIHSNCPERCYPFISRRVVLILSVIGSINYFYSSMEGKELLAPSIINRRFIHWYISVHLHQLKFILEGLEDMILTYIVYRTSHLLLSYYHKNVA